MHIDSSKARGEAYQEYFDGKNEAVVLLDQGVLMSQQFSDGKKTLTSSKLYNQTSQSAASVYNNMLNSSEETKDRHLNFYQRL